MSVTTSAAGAGPPASGSTVLAEAVTGFHQEGEQVAGWQVSDHRVPLDGDGHTLRLARNPGPLPFGGHR